MSQERNQKEIALLKEDPNQLLVAFKPIIEGTVRRFIAKGFFKSDDQDDLVQHIHLDLLEKKLARIQEHFDGSCYLSTYFSKVVYNICGEMARKKKNQPDQRSVETLAEIKTEELSAFQRITIEEELHKLEGYLRGIRKQKEKKVLSLKVFSKVALSSFDFRVYNRLSSFEDVLAYFEGTYETEPEKNHYTRLAELFNEQEAKDGNGDSLRKWVQILVDKIVLRMNGNPPTSFYDRSSLAILFQLFWQKRR